LKQHIPPVTHYPKFNAESESQGLTGKEREYNQQAYEAGLHCNSI